MRARLADQANIFALTVVFQLAEIFAAENIRKAENGVERRAQLMADGGQKSRLGVICRFRLGGLARRILAKLLILGDIAQLADNRGQAAVHVTARCQFHAHVNELLVTAGNRGALQTQIRTMRIPALAKDIDRLQEDDPIGNMDLLDEAAPGGVAHPAEEFRSIAATDRGDITLRVEQQDETERRLQHQIAVLDDDSLCRKDGRPLA